MTSSAIRLASRPTRVASRTAVPWNRLGVASAGGRATPRVTTGGASEVLNQQPDLHMIAPPQRHPVQLHLEAGRGEAGQVQLVGAQLLAGPYGQGIGAGEPQRLPGDGCLGRGLHGHQQPLVGLRQPGSHRALGGGSLGLGLGHLVGREIQVLLLGQDRLPGQVLARCLAEVLQAGLVRRQKDQRVAVQAGRVAAHLQDGLGCQLGSAVALLAVRMPNAQHHQARIQVVRHIGPCLRHRVDAGESPMRARSLRRRCSSSWVTLSGSRLSCSARSSASFVTVGWVEYQ